MACVNFSISFSAAGVRSVPGAGNRHAKLVGSSAGQKFLELRLRFVALGRDGPNLGNRGLVEPARIIREPRRHARLIMTIGKPGPADEINRLADEIDDDRREERHAKPKTLGARGHDPVPLVLIDHIR
jgi:hypothetical protein